MDGFILNVLEGRYLESFIGFFDGTGGDVGGPCVSILLGGIMTDYEIDAMQLNDSSHVSCKAEIYLLLGSLPLVEGGVLSSFSGYLGFFTLSRDPPSESFEIFIYLRHFVVYYENDLVFQLA